MAPTAPSPHPGMGATLHDGGVTFRVWAPHARDVAATGSFDDWQQPVPMRRDGDGSADTWSVHVPGVEAGAEYQLRVTTGGGEQVWRADPYARVMTNSVGNSVVYDPHAFDWGHDDFEMPHWDDVVIYELHVGTFAGDQEHRGTFDRAVERLAYLRGLGISVVQIMPPAEYAGDISWGYNPAHMFAVESTYGGPDAFKRFIRAAHEHGIAVIVDVVHNHIGPSDLDLWRFDGWHEGDGGGIYFYNDWRAETPWGATRPDFGREEVRQFLYDSAKLWLREFRCDGLRFDATAYIRSVHGTVHDAESMLPDATEYLQSLTAGLTREQPWKLLIAEDLQNDSTVTMPVDRGGLGFHAQWDAGFVHVVRRALTELDDSERDMNEVAHGILGTGRGAAGSRVIYTESHDEVANGKTRVPEAIAPGAADSLAAKKRATLGSAAVFFAPGIPMFFQGQEMLADRYFDDAVPLDWQDVRKHPGIVAMHRHLIALRRNRAGTTAGLRGANANVLRVDQDRGLIILHRWGRGGPHDDTLVALNFSAEAVSDYRVGMPRPGRWAVRFNGDSRVYDPSFGDHPVFDVDTDAQPADDCAQSATLAVGAYSAVVLSLEP